MQPAFQQSKAKAMDATAHGWDGYKNTAATIPPWLCCCSLNVVSYPIRHVSAAVQAGIRLQCSRRAMRTHLHGHHEGEDGQSDQGGRAQLEVEEEHGDDDAQGGGDDAHDALAQHLQHLHVAGDHVEDAAAAVHVAPLRRQRQHLVVYPVRQGRPQPEAYITQGAPSGAEPTIPAACAASFNHFGNLDVAGSCRQMCAAN